MGTVKTDLKVCSQLDPSLCQTVKGAIVDTGSTFSMLPSRVLQDVGIERVERIKLTTIKGEKILRDVGDASCEIGDRRAPCRVIFGEEGDASVIGVTTLEVLGFEVDPVQQKLKAKESFLAL